MKIFISVIIPIYNEEKNLLKNLNFIYSKLKKIKKKYEIIIVNDGSTDNTIKIVKKFLSKKNKKYYKLINIKKNSGVANAILLGFKSSRGKFITHCSVDLPYKFENFNKALLFLKNYDVLIFERYSRRGSIWRILTSKTWNLICRIILISKIKDFNFIQVYPKKILDKIKGINQSAACFTVEIIYKALLNDYKIKIIKAKWHVRKANTAKYGKFKDIFESLIALIKLRLQ